jgi:hypothetical protein
MTVSTRIRATGPAVLASCLALTLGACAVFQPAARTEPAPVVTPAVSETPPPPPRKPRPPVPSLARLTTPATEAPESLDRLIGLDQSHIADVLGEPESRAEAPPATIWRYVGAHCAIDIYFYLDLQSQAMRVLHYEVRSHDLSERSAQRCYHALVSEQRSHADSAAGTDRPR